MNSGVPAHVAKDTEAPSTAVDRANGNTTDAARPPLVQVEVRAEATATPQVKRKSRRNALAGIANRPLVRIYCIFLGRSSQAYLIPLTTNLLVCRIYHTLVYVHSTVFENECTVL